MIIIFPLVPVLIAILLLGAALIDNVAASIDSVITIAWIAVIISSAILIICNLRKDTTTGDKIGGVIISIAATVITMIVSKTFLFGLAESSDTSTFNGLFDFAFVFIFGGVIWLSTVGLCAYASYTAYDMHWAGGIFPLIGSLILAGVFGLLG